MSNMMPGDNSGAEPDEHDRRCRTNCEEPLLPRDEEGIDLECVNGHPWHDCNCDEIAEDDAESWAEAQLDWLEDRSF